MLASELDELIGDCPSLYHMAELGAWKGIKKNGLLSTSSLLDLYKVTGETRYAIESQRRDKCVGLSHEGLPKAVVRDQLPMDDSGLLRALPGDISPKQWYEFLNTKVFFWFTKDRLHRLTNAAAYRDTEHEVLVINSRKLIEAYGESIWLCPINSGCTKPMPHPRSYASFSRIVDYPYSNWRGKRTRGERAVELCIDGGVPNITDFIETVVVVKGTSEISTIT